MKYIGNNFAFIDSQNVNLAIREQGWRLDLKRFRKYLLERFCIEKAFLFMGYLSRNESFYQSLRRMGYILIFKPTLQLPGGNIKGNVDAELVLHAMIQYPHYTKALIVTGDGDFYCLANYLRKKKKLLRLMVPNRHRYSSLLRTFGKDIVFMNNLCEKIGYM